MDREPTRGIKIRDTACLLVGLAGIGWMTVVGPVSVPLLVACLVLTGAPGVWQALALFRHLPTGGPSLPSQRAESSMDSGSLSRPRDGDESG